MDLVKSERFPITNEFAAAVCNLPQTYDRIAYHRFIKDWGTVGFWINFVTSLTFNLKKFGQVFTMASVHCVNEEYLFAKFWVIYIYIYIHIIVTRTLRPTKVHCARRINRDSQSKPHSKHKRREFKKMRGWKTSDVKKIKNLIKTFLLNFFIFLRQKLSILAFFLTLSFSLSLSISLSLSLLTSQFFVIFFACMLSFCLARRINPSTITKM